MVSESCKLLQKNYWVEKYIWFFLRCKKRTMQSRVRSSQRLLVKKKNSIYKATHRCIIEKCFSINEIAIYDQISETCKISMIRFPIKYCINIPYVLY